MPSTVIEHINYSEETRELKITFLSGAVYIYFDVPRDVYDQFKAYKSKGTYLNKFIRDKYEFERIDI
jgi:hypothetical protein